MDKTKTFNFFFVNSFLITPVNVVLPDPCGPDTRQNKFFLVLFF